MLIVYMIFTLCLESLVLVSRLESFKSLLLDSSLAVSLSLVLVFNSLLLASSLDGKSLTLFIDKDGESYK